MVLWVIYENFEKKSQDISRIAISAYERIKDIYEKNRRRGAIIAGAIGVILLLVVIFNIPKAWEFVMDFVNGRSGSSNTRFLIYRTSILKAIDDNFLIAQGSR